MDEALFPGFRLRICMMSNRSYELKAEARRKRRLLRRVASFRSVVSFLRFFCACTRSTLNFSI